MLILVGHKIVGRKKFLAIGKYVYHIFGYDFVDDIYTLQNVRFGCDMIDYVVIKIQ